MKDDASEPLDRFSPTLTNDDDAAMQPLEENGAAAAEVVAASDDTLLNAPKRDAAEFASVKQIHKAPVPVADPIAPLNDPKAEYETTPKVSGMEADLKDPDIIAMSFPEKLMEILENEANSDIISWLPHGRGFVIHDKKRFAVEVLTKHFKQAKFTSFTRKLNRWNFTRVTRGPEVGAYYHPSFQKEDFKLASQMSCINAKSAQQLHPLDPVALGVVPLGDPAGILQWTHEQEHWRMYHHYHTQQQAFMAQVMVQQQQAGEAAVNSAVKLEGEPIVDGSNIKEESKDGTVGAHGTSTDALPMPHLDEQQMAAMQSFYEQQHQYYSAVVAQQQHPSPSSTTVEDTAVSGATPPELEPEVHTEISETHETLVLPPAPLDSEQQELSTAEVDAANDGSVEALV